jgi:hypothetical protein
MGCNFELKSYFHWEVIILFEKFRRKRELKEILRLRELKSLETDPRKIKEIKNQIILCESLLWKDYKMFCRTH